MPPRFDFSQGFCERGLGAEPISVGQTEKPAEAQVGVGRDGATARDDFADSLRRNADFLGQAVLRDAERNKKFLFQQFAGGYWLKIAHDYFLTRRVINGQRKSSFSAWPVKDSFALAT